MKKGKDLSKRLREIINDNELERGFQEYTNMFHSEPVEPFVFYEPIVVPKEKLSSLEGRTGLITDLKRVCKWFKGLFI
jgi:hypothetical protein